MQSRMLAVVALLGFTLAGCGKGTATAPDVSGAWLGERAGPVALQAGKKVAAPHSKPHGLTYGQWHARWWQWAYSLPVDNHPLFETGDASAGQKGHVWFLGGSFVSGTANRVISIPSGTALFFPILNFEADNFWPPIDPPLDEAGLRALAASIIDGATGLEAELDGVSIPILTSYRTTSPVFSVTLPDNNIPQSFGFDAPPGSYSPLVDDGYYLFINPLSVGTHHLHFKASVPAFNFTLDITYEIHVTPGNRGGGKRPLGL
jgi:hypothetical protein